MSASCVTGAPFLSSGEIAVQCASAGLTVSCLLERPAAAPGESEQLVNKSLGAYQPAQPSCRLGTRSSFGCPWPRKLPPLATSAMPSCSRSMRGPAVTAPGRADKSLETHWHGSDEPKGTIQTSFSPFGLAPFPLAVLGQFLALFIRGAVCLLFNVVVHVDIRAALDHVPGLFRDILTTSAE